MEDADLRAAVEAIIRPALDAHRAAVDALTRPALDAHRAAVESIIRPALDAQAAVAAITKPSQDMQAFLNQLSTNVVPRVHIEAGNETRAAVAILAETPEVLDHLPEVMTEVGADAAFPQQVDEALSRLEQSPDGADYLERAIERLLAEFSESSPDNGQVAQVSDAETSTANRRPELVEPASASSSASDSSSRLRLAVALALATWVTGALLLHGTNVLSAENPVFDPHQLVTDEMTAINFALTILFGVATLKK